MPMPSFITVTCPECGQDRSAPEGARMPPCADCGVPDVPISVYEKVDGPDYAFFAIAYPPGHRPVKAFGETYKEAEGRVRHLLDC